MKKEKLTIISPSGTCGVLRFNFSGFNRAHTSKIASNCLKEGCILQRRLTLFNSLPFFNRMYYNYKLPTHPKSYAYWCCLNREEIRAYLSEIKLVIPDLKWKYYQTESFIYLTISTKWKPSFTAWINPWPRKEVLRQLYALTRIRYLYEFPFNVILKDAIALAEIKNWNIDQAFTYISEGFYPNSSYRFGRPGLYNSNHSIVNPCGRIPQLDLLDSVRLRKRIAEFNDKSYLHQLIKVTTNQIRFKFIKYGGSLLEILEFWEDPEYKQLRLSEYCNPNLYNKEHEEMLEKILRKRFDGRNIICNNIGKGYVDRELDTILKKMKNKPQH